MDKNYSFYSHPNGSLYLVVDTAGASEYEFLGREPYNVTQFKRFGFLNADVLDDGTKMIGTFYDSRDGIAKDHFTITKK